MKHVGDDTGGVRVQQQQQGAEAARDQRYTQGVTDCPTGCVEEAGGQLPSVQGASEKETKQALQSC